MSVIGVVGVLLLTEAAAWLALAITVMRSAVSRSRKTAWVSGSLAACGVAAWLATGFLYGGIDLNATVAIYVLAHVATVTILVARVGRRAAP